MKTADDMTAGDPRRADEHGARIDTDASPRTIEKQIDAKRADINRTLSALEERFSPGQMVDQTLGMFRENGGEMASNLGRQIRDNPMPFLVAGAGIAWAMLSTSRAGGSSVGHYRSRYGYDGDFAGRDFDERQGAYGSSYDGAVHGYGDRGRGPVGSSGSDFTPRYTAGEIPSTSGSYADAYSDDQEDDGFLDKARDGFDALGNRLSDAAEDLGRAVSSMGEEARGRYESMSDDARARYDEGRRRYAEMDAEGRRRYRDMQAQARAKRADWERGLQDGMASARAYGRDASRRTRLQARSAAESVEEFVQEQPMVAGALGVAVGALIGALLPASQVEDRYVGEYADEARRVAREQGEAGMERAQEAAEGGLEQLRDKVEDVSGTIREKAEQTAKEARDVAGSRLEEADRKASVGDDESGARETSASDA